MDCQSVIPAMPIRIRSFRVARQNEAAGAADAAAWIGASVSALDRRTAAAYHHRGERQEQYIDEHQ